MELKKIALALTLGVVTVAAFTVSNSPNNTLSSSATLSENAAIASVAAEDAEGTCCEGGVLCIIGRYTLGEHYLLGTVGKPCP